MAENLIHKTLDCEVKKVDDNIYEFVASTEEMDRDGEAIDISGWDLKNFKKNPVVMYGHNYNQPPIGRAPRIWASKDGHLKNHVEFPPEGTYEFADIIHRLVDTGFIKAESVGFIPKEWEDGDGEKSPRKTYKKQELLEISIVPIPSNPNAIREAVKAGVITTKEFEVITKPEETDEYIRIPVDRGNHEGHRIRTIDISAKEGIKAIYCGTDKVIMTYLFAKDKGWTMEKAKTWVREHEKYVVSGEDENGKPLFSIPHPKEISQNDIRDELDYLIRLIDTEGMNDDVKGDSWGLVEKLLRLAGNDIPDNIRTLIKPDVSPIVETEKLTQSDISEAIKRIATK